MNKQFIPFLLLALLLAACQPVGTPAASLTPPPAATAVPLPTQAPVPQATPTQAATLLPSATLAPTAAPTMPQPSATAGAGQATAGAGQATPAAGQAAAFKDCALLPALPACGGKLPLTGRLALIDSANQRLALVDFKGGAAWQEPLPGTDVALSFSPSGKQAAAVASTAAGVPSTVYDVGSGKQVQSVTLQGQAGWTPQGALVASPFRTVWSAAGDQAFIDYNTALAHLRFAAQPDKDVPWPVSVAPGDRIAQAVAWVPGTDLLLFEQHTAGSSMWITGGTLFTLNVKNGAIKDLKANMALTFRFQWQPSASGVLVYGDSAASPVMGGRSLFVLNVVSGSRKAVQLSDQVNVSAPAFTPDGQSILFGAALPAGMDLPDSPFHLPAVYLVNPTTGKVRALTQPPAGSSDTLPQLQPDGKNFLFYRVNDQEQTFSLRLGSLAGDLDAPVTGSLPLPARVGPDLSFDSVLVYQP